VRIRQCAQLSSARCRFSIQCARVVLFSNQSSNFPLCACVCKAVDGITSAFIIRAIPQLIPTLPGTRARSFTGGGGGDGGG